MDKTQSLNCIRVHLQVIYSCLHKVNEEILEAMTAVDTGNQNLAIGVMLEVPDRLETAKSCCDAIMRIHRHSR